MCNYFALVLFTGFCLSLLASIISQSQINTYAPDITFLTDGFYFNWKNAARRRHKDKIPTTQVQTQQATRGALYLATVAWFMKVQWT